MSPEQASAEAVDARSDIFSLGIVFWEALTYAPVQGRERPALVAPDPRDDAAAAVGGGAVGHREIDAVVGKMLARRRRTATRAARRWRRRSRRIIEREQAGEEALAGFLEGLNADAVAAEPPAGLGGVTTCKGGRDAAHRARRARAGSAAGRAAAHDDELAGAGAGQNAHHEGAAASAVAALARGGGASRRWARRSTLVRDLVAGVEGLDATVGAAAGGRDAAPPPPATATTARTARGSRPRRQRPRRRRARRSTCTSPAIAARACSLDGKLLGAIPLDADVPRRHATATMLVTRPGYESWRLGVALANDLSVGVPHLTPVPRARPRPATSPPEMMDPFHRK